MKYSNSRNKKEKQKEVLKILQSEKSRNFKSLFQK